MSDDAESQQSTLATRLAEAQARERVAAAAYQRQQTAQREGETLYMAAVERAEAAERTAAECTADLARYADLARLVEPYRAVVELAAALVDAMNDTLLLPAHRPLAEHNARFYLRRALIEIDPRYADDPGQRVAPL